MAPKKSAGGKGKGEGEEGADRVHVVVRIRPPVRNDEKYGEGSESLQYDKEKNMLFLLAKGDDGKANPKQYIFDRVLWKDSVQHDAWDAAGISIVKSAMQGYTGCVMCYGQTGAGKTYTLANEKPGHEGIMIQAFNYMFETARNERELKYEIGLSYQQIYLDGISDLLQPANPVELREDPKDGVYVSGAKWETVTTAGEAIAALQKGNSNRSTASTKMNADSSRSHAALILRIKCTGGVRTLNGMLYLVDLAGSERVKKSGVEGNAFDEAKAINQSLTTLGRCIEVLGSNKKEKPPFRDSKLTRLLSNAIGGAAKTTLVVCVAPTMTDQFETVNSLDFGQQAMNVVVRAKVNASTDYNSLTASLLQQRDKKCKPIRELEAKIMGDLKPKLDETISLELACKKSALEVEIMEEKVDAQKDRLAATQAAGEAELDADKAKTAQLLNERADATQQLEAVLVQLSSDPEMKRLQDEHEHEKADTMKKSMMLSEELRAAEQQERHQNKQVDATLEGIVHTARNLGQIAAYFLNTGANAEAADFYAQAKHIFDTLLGPEHPKTQAWQEDMFFLVNAPAIQTMAKVAQKELQDLGKVPSGPVDSDDPASSMPEWWMQNLFEMGGRAGGGDLDDDEIAGSWWMQNLYSMGNHEKKEEIDDGADYMQILFGTPRDGTTTARGGPAFTPRGTLVALSHASGKSGAALSLGMPLQKQTGGTEGSTEHDTGAQRIDMTFSREWVHKVFETPRNGGEMQEDMEQAVIWLQDNFGMTPRDGSLASAAANLSITPRGSRQDTALSGFTVQVDDAVFKAAMQATLSTPRVPTATASTDALDTPMSGAVNKMFKGARQVV